MSEGFRGPQRLQPHSTPAAGPDQGHLKGTQRAQQTQAPGSFSIPKTHSCLIQHTWLEAQGHTHVGEQWASRTNKKHTELFIVPGILLDIWDIYKAGNH